MTRDELYRKRMMFQIYANRNKIPQMQTNANNEPLKHSATNEYLEYRKKVAAGIRMQRENDESNLFNVTAANEQYYQDLMDQNVIIHAGTYKPAGTHEYVAVLPDFWGKGKHRYFYTQEEWDNYNKNKAASGQAGAARGTKEGADAKNKALASAGQKAYADTLKNPFKEAYNKAKTDLANKTAANKAQEAYADSQKNKALNQALTGRENAIANSKGGSKDDAQDVSDNVKNYNASRKEWEKNSQANPEAQRAQKMMENADKKDAENITDKVRSHNASRKEWEKNSQANPGAQRGTKESERADAEKQSANQSGSANAAKAEGEAYDEYMRNKKQSANQSGSANAAKSEGEAYDEYKRKQAIDKKLKEEYDKNAASTPGADRAEKESEEANAQKKAKKDMAANQSGSAMAGAKEGFRAQQFKTINEHNAEVDKKASDREYKAAENILKDKDRWNVYSPDDRDEAANEMMKNNGFKNLHDIYKYEGGAEAFFDDLEDLINKKNGWGKYDKKNQGFIGRAKMPHSSLEDGITTAELTPEQEYLNFRAKVEAGMKHFGLMRGLMTIPINQGLKNGDSLMHAGTSKYGDYYNKIDNYYGPGKARYFKTKDEWDAHQRELDSYSKKAQEDVAKRDQLTATQNEWKKNSQANPGAQRGSREYVNGKIANRQNQKETANKNYYNTQSNANPEQRRGFAEAAQGRLAGSNFTPSTTGTKFNGTPNMNLYGVDNNAAAKTAAANNNYQDIYRNNLLNQAQSGREAAIANAQKNSYRNNLLAQAQSGRDAAMNNSGSLVSKGNNPFSNLVQNVAGDILLAENRAQKDARNKNLVSAGQSSYQDAYRNNLLNQAQSGRDAAINNSAPSIYEGDDNYYGPQSGRALEAEFVGKDQDFFNESKAKDAEALQKYIAKELGVTKRIIADNARWNKYRTDVKNIVMDQMMDYYGFNNLSDIYKYEGGPEAFFDDLEAAIAKESMRLSEKTT